MAKRPRSITVISWIFITFGGVSFLGRLAAAGRFGRRSEHRRPHAAAYFRCVRAAAATDSKDG